MDVVTAAKLWLTVKPIKRIREARQKRKEQTSEGIEYEVSDMSLREKIGNLRTSTKAGAAGLGTMGGMAVMLIPFAEEAEALIQQACQSENGAVPFLVGGAIVWAVTVVSARLSRTPEKPGAI